MVSSSALRWRGLRSSRMPALPSRLTWTVPRSAEPVARKSSRRSSASAVGRSIAWIRWVPARGEERTCPRNSPWAISTPSLSPSLRSSSAATLGRVGVRPGKRSAAVVHELLVAHLVGEVAGERGVDLLDVNAQELLAGRVQRIGDRVGRGLLALGAARPWRKPARQRLAHRQELARGAGVGIEAAGRRRRCRPARPRPPRREGRLPPGCLRRRSRRPTICHSL